MIALSLIPLPYRIAGVAILAASVFGAWEWRWHSGFKAGVQQQVDKQAVIDSQRRQVALDEEASRRKKDAETNRRILKAEDDAYQAQVAQRADKLIADAASGDLRRRFEQRLRDMVQAVHATAAARGSGTGGSQAAPSGEAEGDVAGMLADVYGRCLQQRQRYAEIADEARTSGQLCERAYDALTAAP
jgi:hypothetical protein